MARWRLMDKHYLNVPGTEWEYKESDRESGKMARKIFIVPLYLNPEDKADQNYPSEGMIIVTNKFDRAHPKDILFEGDPTPDMEPLDDEATGITERIRASGRWVHPIESLDMNYSQSLLSSFEKQIASLVAKGAAVATAPVVNLSGNGIPAEEFTKLQQQVALLMERNAQLEEAVASKPARRI